MKVHTFSFEKWKTTQKLNLEINDAIADSHNAECYFNKNEHTINTINMLTAQISKLPLWVKEVGNKQQTLYIIAFIVYCISSKLQQQ